MLKPQNARRTSAVCSNLPFEALGVTARRLCSVLAWGRNAEGQAGVEGGMVVVPRPTPVLELTGCDVTDLSAGKLHSCAVTADGSVWSWGDGALGKLGHGSADPCAAPARVESLVDRAAIVSASLGDSHSLFLDRQGQVWTCGDNREGQLGLGTAQEVVTAQRNKDWEPMQRLLALQSQQRQQQAGRHSARDAALTQHLRSLMQPSAQAAAGSVGAFMAQAGGGSSLSSSTSSGGGSVAWAFTGGGGGAAATTEAALMALNFGGRDVDGHFSAAGLQAGQLTSPTRLGHDRHLLARAAAVPWAGWSQSGAKAVAAASSQDTGAALSDSSDGLEGHTVVSMDASPRFSAAVTDRGELWTFGPGGHSGLGGENSTEAQRVDGELAKVLADNGGAVRVAAGGTFCVALTASGKAVVWGTITGPPSRVDDKRVLVGTGMMGGAPGSGRVVAGVVPGLPPIIHIAAGQRHALLSDGERVWAIGRWVDALGSECGAALWSEPQELLELAGQGIASLSAGVHCSAAVTAGGNVYMWGRLLDARHAQHLAQRPWGPQQRLPDEKVWQWAGFGSDAPKRVEGLEGVKSIALGGWHAMAVVA